MRTFKECIIVDRVLRHFVESQLVKIPNYESAFDEMTQHLRIEGLKRLGTTVKSYMLNFVA